MSNKAGSLVESQRLRFDFQHFEAISPNLLAEIQNLVNDYIEANAEIQSETLALEEALKKGALAFFGEKYAAEVVLSRLALTVWSFAVVVTQQEQEI